MTARALNRDTQTCRGCDAGHHSQGEVLALKQRTLFNVQFDKCLVIIAREPDAFECSAQASFSANVIEGRAFAVFQLLRGLGRQSRGKQSAANASDSKARRLF